MKFRQLEALRAVLMHGIISRAAESLNISQPAVSRLIADLEHSIGFSLFVRRRGRLYPSPEAKSFGEELDRSFVGLDRLEQAAREIKDLRRGEIYVAGMPSISLDILPNIISLFTEHHPDVKITFDLHTSPRIVDLVAAGQFDLGFGQISTPEPNVEILYSLRTHCVAVMKNDNPLCRKKIIRPEHLREQNLISFAHHTLAAKSIAQVMTEADVPMRSRVECQPSYVVCSLALQGAGVVLVDPMTARFFSPLGLKIKTFKPDVPFDFRIIKPRDVSTSKVGHRFLEIAIEILKKDKLIAVS